MLDDNIEKYYNDLINGISDFSRLVLKDVSIKSLDLKKRKNKTFVENSKTLSVGRKKVETIEYLDYFVNPVLSICLQTKSKRGRSTVEYFEEIYFSTRKFISQNLALIYFSKTKVNALWDLQIVFPDLFKVNSYISIVSEKNNFFQNSSKQKNQEEIFEFNNFFLKTKTVNFDKIKDKENEDKKRINEIQNLKETQFKAEKIKNSMANTPHIDIDMTNTIINAVPTTNVFFNSQIIASDHDKPNLQERSSQRKTINQLKFFDLDNISSEEEDVDTSSLIDVTPIKDNFSNDKFFNIKSNIDNKDTFENFQLKKKSTKNSEIEFFKNISMYKDYLSLNSTILNEELIFSNKNKIIEICKQYRDTIYINNFCNFILSNSIKNSSKHTDIMYLSKVGPNISVNPIGIFDNLDITNITKTSDLDILSNLFFKSMVDYSRVIVVFRPMIIRCGLNEVLLNIFKINGFSILKRKFMKLSKNDAKFLFGLEELDQNFCEDYVRIMTESEIEVICLSRFGAVKFLLNDF